jgi:hypothetical protein
VKALIRANTPFALAFSTWFKMEKALSRSPTVAAKSISRKECRKWWGKSTPYFNNLLMRRNEREEL